MLKKMVIIIGILLLFPSLLFAGEIRVKWDPVMAQNVDHYTVHWGVSHRVYTGSADTTDLFYTIPGLSAGTYYVAVDAVDTSDNVSLLTYEVVKDVPFDTPTGLVIDDGP